MAEEGKEPAPDAAGAGRSETEAPHAASGPDASGASGTGGPPPGTADAPGGASAGATEPPPAPEAPPDPWAVFDTVLQAFAIERRVAPGTFWGESPAEVDGRFVGWANSVGWRCTLQLIRAPEENVVVLVAQGPPLPGGRARMLVLGAFPPDFDQSTLRAALEVGYSIGETWGPAEESPPPAPEANAPPHGSSETAAS